MIKKYALGEPFETEAVMVSVEQTQGMMDFGKTEIEIIDSEKSLEEIRDFLYFVCLHILKSDMNFYDGETLRFTSDAEYTITKSEDVYVDGQTFKISY